MKRKCINCGENAEFTLSNVGDSRKTSGRCTNCGQTMEVSINTAQKSIIEKPASDKAGDEEKKRDFPTRRKDPLKRLQDDPKFDEDVRGVKAKMNPFVKKSDRREQSIVFEIGYGAGKNINLPPSVLKEDAGRLIETYKDDLIQGISTGIAEKGDTIMASNNPFIKKTEKEVLSKSNPFVKQAREFEFTDEQKEKREKTNMVFPQGGLEEDGKGSGKSLPHSKFDTVDRKENNTRPDPVDFVPGYKEWDEAQIDHFYDGWVEDHIRNSGGEIVGSNTDKVMNLEDGEREHVPEYPTEAVYEKLLESRHEFGDYETIIANKKERVIKKADLVSILKQAQFDFQEEVSIRDNQQYYLDKVIPWIEANNVENPMVARNLINKVKSSLSDLIKAVKEMRANTEVKREQPIQPSLEGINEQGVLDLDQPGALSKIINKINKISLKK